MNPRNDLVRRATWLISAALILACATALAAQHDADVRKLAREIFQQLIEINTTDSVGSTTVAAEAVATRLRAAGFAMEDIQVLGPSARKGNLIARLRGTGARRPLLLIAHLDVVEARREDWSFDPFNSSSRMATSMAVAPATSKTATPSWSPISCA